MVQEFTGIPLERWGKDHWSLLAYIETCSVDHQGKLSFDRMRCNRETHPLQHACRKYPTSEALSAWKPTWGTYLKESQLSEHDDWDCLADLYYAGLVVHPSNDVVHLTEKGIKIVQQLRVFKSQSGQYKDFGTVVVL